MTATKTTKPRTKKTAATKTEPALVAFKGFGPDWKCLDFQYEVGKTYEHKGRVEACASGFHACENPLDVWSYYSLTDSKFAVVELSGELSRHGDDSKVAAGRITIKAEIGLPQIVSEGIRYVLNLCKAAKDGEAASGDGSKQAASGYGSKQAASGKNAVIMAAGKWAKAKAAEGGCFALRWDDDSRPASSLAT